MTTKGRILICDDDGAFSKGVKELLRMEGYDVVTRSTASKSIQCLTDDQKKPNLRDRFAVVIVDLDFRDKSGTSAGIEILEVARKDPLLESVVCTGQGTQELAAKAITLGVFSYIIKAKPSEDGTDLFETVMRASELHSQCLDMIEEIERLADAHQEIPAIRALAPHFIEYVRNIRGRGR